jgi:hypothetical protein
LGQISRTGIVGAVDVTDEDRGVADLATASLAERGHDFSVTGEQVVRWRKVADAIPVDPASQRGGRGQRVRYLPGAPQVAAEIALALDAERDLDVAVLAAFGSGAPVAEKGVRAAAHRVLQQSENKARVVYAKSRFKRRSDIPRSLRVPINGSRRADAGMVSDTLLSMLVGEEPVVKMGAADRVLRAFVDEGELDTPTRLPVLRFAVSRFSFAALRQFAHNVDIQEWRRGTIAVSSVVDWVLSVSKVCDLTGVPWLNAPGPQGRSLTLLRSILLRPAIEERPSGYLVALWGLLVAALTTGSVRRSRAYREVTTRFEYEGARWRAALALVEDTPERWRPALAPASGPAFLAQMSESERTSLMAHTRQWVASHKTEGSALNQPPIPADALSS